MDACDGAYYVSSCDEAVIDEPEHGINCVRYKPRNPVDNYEDELLKNLIDKSKFMYEIYVKNLKDKKGLKFFNELMEEEVNLIEKITGKKWSEI
jgi:hypothetical protein